MQQFLKGICPYDAAPHANEYVKDAICMGMLRKNGEQLCETILERQAPQRLYDIGGQLPRGVLAVHSRRDMMQYVDRRINEPFAPPAML